MSPKADSNSACTARFPRSEEHTSELQSHVNLVCCLLLEKKKPISFDQRSSWVVRKDSPILADSLNSWFERTKSEPVYLRIEKRYFEETKGYSEIRQLSVNDNLNFCVIPPQPRYTLFPYTTLFR